jgi:hypothetical protein
LKIKDRWLILAVIPSNEIVVIKDTSVQARDSNATHDRAADTPKMSSSAGLQLAACKLPASTYFGRAGLWLGRAA